MLLKHNCILGGSFNPHTKRLNISPTKIDKLSLMGVYEPETDTIKNVRFVGVYRDKLFYIDPAISYYKVIEDKIENSIAYRVSGAGTFKKFVKNANIIW